MSEDSRAAEYRRMMTARAAAKRTAEKALAGSAVAAASLAAGTKALLEYDENGVRRDYCR